MLFAFLKEFNKPIVWTLHDCWPFTGHCVHFDYMKCYKWKSICNNCPQINTYPRSFIDRSARNYRLKKESFSGFENLTIVPVSDWLGNMVKESFLCDNNVHRIYNGVDIDIFYPKKSKECVKNKYNIDTEFLILGVAGSWTTRKGLEDFVALSKKLPDWAKIILVGLSTKQIGQLPKNIIGINGTDNIEQLASIYSAADLLFNASKEETFGMTAAEAMACGTPVIVYNATACPEVVSQETGFVIETGDLDGVMNAIIEIHIKGKDYYSEKCRNRAEKLFEKNRQFELYIKLYDSLLTK